MGRVSVGEGQPGAPWPDLDRFLRGQGQRDRGYEACTKNMTTKGGAPSEVCFYKRGVLAIVRSKIRVFGYHPARPRHPLQLRPSGCGGG